MNGRAVQGGCAAAPVSLDALEIVECGATQKAEWDAFVRSAEGEHYLLYGWKEVIEEVYGHSCVYLLARRRGAVVGLLPLCCVKSRLFGRSLTSLPFLDTAGALTDSSEVSEALVNHGVRLAQKLGLEYLELRQRTRLAGPFRVDTDKISLTMPLFDDLERQWSALSSERRNRVRKAEKQELRAQQLGPEGVRDFYRVWSENMRDLGSPAHSLAWFSSVLNHFPQSASLLGVLDGPRWIGSALLLVHQGMLSVPWVSSLRGSFTKHPNDLLYWASIKLGVEMGCSHFDFGRSTAGSGNHVYKSRWGAEASPIYWHYLGLEGREPRLPGSESPILALATRVWKKLPVAVANRVGPALRKRITR